MAAQSNTVNYAASSSSTQSRERMVQPHSMDKIAVDTSSSTTTVVYLNNLHKIKYMEPLIVGAVSGCVIFIVCRVLILLLALMVKMMMFV